LIKPRRTPSASEPQHTVPNTGGGDRQRSTPLLHPQALDKPASKIPAVPAAALPLAPASVVSALPQQFEGS